MNHNGIHMIGNFYINFYTLYNLILSSIMYSGFLGIVT